MSSRLPAAVRTGLLLLIAGVFSVSQPGAMEERGFPLITSFGADAAGIATRIWSIVQAPTGEIVFGGDTLATFDGERWHSTRVPGAYLLRGLDFDKKGRLWVAANGNIGWFERTAGHDWIFQSLRTQLPAAESDLGGFWRVFADEGGSTFIAKDAVLRWTGTDFQMWPMRGTRRLLASRVNGTIYVHYVGTGLYKIGAEGPELIIPQSAIGDLAAVWMGQRAAKLLLATQRGLFLFGHGKLESFAPEVSDYITREAVTCGVQFPDGRFAFGTMKGGVVIMRADGTLERVLREEDGLPSVSIMSLLLDPENGLWVGSTGHVVRVPLDSSTAIFDHRAHLPPKSLTQIARSGETLVVATPNELFQLGRDGIFAPAGFREAVFGMRASENGVLVAGYHGVKRVKETSVTSVYVTETDATVATPSKRRPETLFVSTNRMIVAVAKDGTSQVVVNGLPDYAMSIAEDGDGCLWLGTTAHGVFFAKLARDQIVSAVPAGTSLGLAVSGQSLVRDAYDGAILVFAENGGWIKLRGTAGFAPIENYPNRAIAAASEVAQNNVAWIVHATDSKHATGAARITIKNDRATWEPHAIAGLETIGAPRSILTESDATRSTILWIGGSGAILRTVVTKDLVAPQPRAPRLHVFAQSVKSQIRRSVLTALPYSTRAVEFEFATTDFSDRTAMRLETRVDEIDPDWLPAGPDSRRELTALRDGRYTFRVRTVAETGVASEPTVFRFEVLPPWWRTKPAIILGACALVPLGLGINLLRLRALRRRNAELEKKVQERTEELAEANAAKTQFVANMSHDIRNPLNGIVGLALALEESRLDSRQREIVATLRECTTYLSTLVDDVLDFASIEAGRVELRPGPFVPQKLLHSIVETLKADTAESGAQLTVETGPGVPANLLGDAGRIQQILVNFVSNALKYAGGKIRLSVSVPPGSTDEVEFAVTDEGRGLSAAEQATLFTKFSRLRQKQGGEEIPGAGLGLASCRLLADIMGGSVGVESQVGHGARFILRLPLAIATAPAEVPAGSLPNTTVLVVEDADYNAWAAAAVLSKLGLSCERARTGAEALMMFGEKRYNVVLLDRNLPDMDGTEVARRMREMESDGLQAVLLAVTAYCTEADRELCLKAGMDAFVGKPLTPQKLRKVLLAVGRRMLAAGSVHLQPETTVAELDLALLTYLSEGSEESMEGHVRRFLASLSETETQLADALRARDFVRLASGAHRLLGQAKMVGGTALAQAASELESAAQSRNESTCREVLRRVSGKIQAITEAMRHRPPAAQSV